MQSILHRIACWVVLLAVVSPLAARNNIQEQAEELVRLAENLAQDSYDHFKGWKGEISDQEQAVLFKSESFAASCRLFLKLSGNDGGYFHGEYVRTNLYNAYLFLTRSFRELEQEMRRGGVSPYVLGDCRRLLERMDRNFAQMPSAENLAYLHNKYVKTASNDVYLIERRGSGDYVLHAFRNLESLFRYNYEQKRGKDPWKYVEKVPPSTLAKMEQGEKIDLSFEGCLVADPDPRPNRPVYLIRGGRKCGVASPAVIDRYGGWSKVYEVPYEVINSYPEGPAVN